jgi:hypothetical protein
MISSFIGIHEWWNTNEENRINYEDPSNYTIITTTSDGYIPDLLRSMEHNSQKMLEHIIHKLRIDNGETTFNRSK